MASALWGRFAVAPAASSSRARRLLKPSCVRGTANKPDGWFGKKRPYNFLSSKTLSYIGAPVAAGHNPGVEKGPQMIREGGILAVAERLGWDFHDVGDLDMRSAMSQFKGPSAMPEVKNCEQIALGNKLLHDTVKEEARKGNFVLTVGGETSILSATLSAMHSVHDDLAVICVNAHADCNTPSTSYSGHYHGMSLAHVLNWIQPKLPGWDWLGEEHMLKESRVALVGLRDVDDTEREMLRQSGVHYWTMHDIDRWGIGSVMDSAVRHVNPFSDRPMHLMMDIDVCDPTIAPGTGFICRGGLDYREAHFICEMMGLTNNLVSMDLVEVNPDLDLQVPSRMHGDDELLTADLQTVRLGVELIGSAVGKIIA